VPEQVESMRTIRALDTAAFNAEYCEEKLVLFITVDFGRRLPVDIPKETCYRSSGAGDELHSRTAGDADRSDCGVRCE
jgi:hypothetical protein